MNTQSKGSSSACRESETRQDSNDHRRSLYPHGLGPAVIVSTRKVSRRCPRCAGNILREGLEEFCLQCGFRASFATNNHDHEIKPIQHDYKSQLTGRCWECNIRYVWNKKGNDGRPTKLKDALCPICHSPLKPTTYLFTSGPTRDEVPEKRKN